ncbi:RNA-guided endonuclease TnpB family protein [Actinomadura hibisca]|uniref:RNA-guided endonuclease TnpB family protein n=1 Tax=Actinomadura hibisca TaxID=68565 RepID=UPI0012F7DDAC|nr:RNA-guided endonuclease TnpB family protein [Actinomadura hibisca]
MSRMTAFRFTLDPTPAQEALLRTAGGAARLTYNTLLALVKERLDARHAAPESVEVAVPWSSFDLINAANQWKRAALAQQIDPATGQPWHRAIPALVFEEAAVDLARALAAFTASRTGRRPGPRMRFPRFKNKRATSYNFRLRNQKESIVLGTPQHPRTLRLPRLGVLAVREDTRKVRRMLRSVDGQEARARICSVTVRQHRGRWIVVVTVRAADLHPAARHFGTASSPAVTVPTAPALAGELPPASEQTAVWAGVDVGLIDLMVVADQHGDEQTRVPAPKYHRRRLEGLRRRARALSRAQPGSRNHRKARARVARYQACTAAMREHHLHQVSNRLVKSHARLVIEDLNVKGMLANHHLAASVADASFGTLGRMLAYKADWHGTRLVVADRWFPSSKTCSGCGTRKPKLTLSERTFVCSACGLELDRDVNAAANLARYGRDLERLGRDPSPDPGPASSRPG